MMIVVMLFLSTWSGYWLHYNNRLRLYSSIHMFGCCTGCQLGIPLYPSRGWPSIHRCTCCELCRFWSCCFPLRCCCCCLSCSYYTKIQIACQPLFQLSQKLIRGSSITASLSAFTTSVCEVDTPFLILRWLVMLFSFALLLLLFVMFLLYKYYRHLSIAYANNSGYFLKVIKIVLSHW